MLGLVLNGIFAAAVVCSTLYLQSRVSQPALLLVLTAIAAFAQWVRMDRQKRVDSYHGISDVISQIHWPSARDSFLRWSWRGVQSWTLSWMGGFAGPEGAAAEWGYAATLNLRSRSAKWFEQRRRTDASCVLAAAIAASFNAPFAAILVPIELGLGGRTLSTVICALSATIALKTGTTLLDLKIFDLSGTLDGLDFSAPKAWIGLLLTGVAAGVVATGWLKFTELSRTSLKKFAPQWMSGKVLAVGLVLYGLAVLVPSTSVASRTFLHELFLTNLSSGQAGVLFVGTALSLSLVLIGFGTIGIFWPLFALGGYFGYLMHGVFLHLPVSGTVGYAPLFALAGAASFWAAILDLPIASCVLALEMTGEIRAALLCLGASLVAQQIARKLGTSLTARDLESKGMRIVEGRSSEILDSLKVGDAMVTDYDTIHEQDPVKGLAARLLASRYPFLPVVRGDGIFTGLVTVDMVQDRLQEAHPAPEVARIFEVKDLLYSSGFKPKTLRAGDSLASTQGLFQDNPCVPVLTDDGRVQGLLFVHHVRLSYEKEMARRSLQAASSANEFHEWVQPVQSS